jgi:hypothetical protein
MITCLKVASPNSLKYTSVCRLLDLFDLTKLVYSLPPVLPFHIDFPQVKPNIYFLRKFRVNIDHV